MARKLKLEKVRNVEFLFDIEIDGVEVEHDFTYTQLSSKELDVLAESEENGLKAQHKALRKNTVCVTEGLTPKDAEKVRNKLFSDIWEFAEPGSWFAKMQKELGNDKKKK